MKPIITDCGYCSYEPEEFCYYVTDQNGFAPLGEFRTYEEAEKAAINMLRRREWKDRIFVDWFDLYTDTHKSIEIIVA